MFHLYILAKIYISSQSLISFLISCYKINECIWLCRAKGSNCRFCSFVDFSLRYICLLVRCNKLRNLICSLVRCNGAKRNENPERLAEGKSLMRQFELHTFISKKSFFYRYKMYLSPISVIVF